jgi:hypothetical protein
MGTSSWTEIIPPEEGDIGGGSASYAERRKAKTFDVSENRIDHLASIGDQALVDTRGFIADLQTLLRDLDPPSVGNIDYTPPSWTPPNYDERPPIDPLNETTDWPDDMGDLKLDEVDPIDGVTFPTFSIDDPDFKDHEVEGWDDDLTPPDDPDDPVYPGDVPDTTGTPPTPPVITYPTIPPAPTTSLAPFDRNLVPWDVSDPGQFEWDDAEHVYTSDIWADLLAKVLHNIRNGGTGLDAQVEEDIYWQHLNRTFHENEKLIQQATDYWAARGFTMPPGMLSSQINEANAQVSRNNLQASKEITISQAELAQKNTHFFIEKGVQLEGMLREFFIQQVNAALNAQRAIAENAIAIHDAQVKKYNYFLEEFRAWIAKFETDMKYELGKVELYKAEMEGAKTHADVEKAKADVYSSEVNGYRSRVDAYSARIQANMAKVEVEKLKMQVFGEQIRAFLGKIEMNKARIMEFEAKIKGESAKAEAYRSRIDAFIAETDAKKAELQGQIAEQQSYLQLNQGYIEEYKAKADGYKARVAATASEVQFKVEGYKALVSAYQAETQREDAANRVQIAALEAEIKRAALEIQRGVAQVNAAVQGYIGVKQLEVTGTSGIMNVGAQLAASAMNAVNTSASISYSGSDSYGASNSFSQSRSESKTESDSTSESTSHSYNYEM